jgi:hypothetical protein
LLQALEFKESCVRIHKKNNPNAMSTKNLVSEAFHSTAIEGAKEYFILGTQEDVLLNDDDDDTMSQNQFVHIDQTTTTEDGQEYSIYELEQVPKMAPKPKSPKKPESITRLKCERTAASTDEIIEGEEEEESIVDGDKSNAKMSRKSYSLKQKMEIIDYSEKHSNREASRFFTLNESTVRSFRRQKDSLLKMAPTKSTNRRGTPYWPDLELKLKEWTEQQRKKPKINEIKNQAVTIATELGYDGFNGSQSWTFKFMQRHNINSSQPRPRKQTLKSEATDD